MERIDMIKTASISQYITGKKSFISGSSRGVKLGDTYSVFSYETLIAQWKGNALVFFDETKYSVTTSKLQNIIRSLINYRTVSER